MKILLTVFLILLEIIIKSEETQDLRQIYRYSKRVQIPVQRSIKIINARKFEKLKALESRKANNIKQGADKITYTAFPPISERRLLDVPEDIVQESSFVNKKSRVKKVLPEYSLTVFRKKRSINNVSTVTSKNIKKKHAKRRKNSTITIKGAGKNSKNSGKNTKKKRKSKRNGTERIVIKKLRAKKLNATQNKLSNRGKLRSRVSLKYTSNPRKKVTPRYRDAVLNKFLNKKSVHRGASPERKVRNRRLIAARDAMIEEYPYVVSIQKDGQHWCAGALLNHRLVITTANCVWKSRSVSRMTIRAGSRYMNRGGQVANIQEVVKHPSWSIRSLPDNDVALLLLDRNIKFSDSVHDVDIPNQVMYPVFDDAWVTSWGAERRDGIFKTVGVTLQVYHARLLNHAKCNNITQRFGVSVSRNFICLAQTGRRAPCTRDTGAPAVSDGIVWGLASWGIRRLCGTERFPAMFSYLASKSNLDFITNATHYLMSDKRDYPYPDRFVINRSVTKTITTKNA